MYLLLLVAMSLAANTDFQRNRPLLLDGDVGDPWPAIMSSATEAFDTESAPAPFFTQLNMFKFLEEGEIRKVSHDEDFPI